MCVYRKDISHKWLNVQRLYNAIFYKLRYVYYIEFEKDWRQTERLIITQDSLIKQIADKEDINVAIVRKVFKSAEDIIFDHLSSITPSENIIMKILNGISLKRKYIPTKIYSKGMFKSIDCTEHVNIKVNSSTYYTKRVNDKLFS